MELETFCTLLTQTGQQAIQTAASLSPREDDFLQHYQYLIKQYPPNLARAALETVVLRLEATAKYPFAELMYLTREALEQASNWEISVYRAQRYRSYDQIIDLGCSIGSDTLALAKVAPTLGLDLDPLRIMMAQANTAALKLDHWASFIRSDLTFKLPIAPLSSSIGLFFDPSRRKNHRRAFSVKHYNPPLSIIENWLTEYNSVGVKVSPAVDYTEINCYDSELEFISLGGKLKEAILWFGSLKNAYRRATILPGPNTLSTTTKNHEKAQLKLPLSEPLAILYEPNPAVIRARLVYQLGVDLSAAQLDPDIAYLTSEELHTSKFANAWAIEDWLPFSLKRLRTYLRERHVGQVTIKKRGSPLQPEALINRLRLNGDEERILFLTHLRGKPIVVICFPQLVI